MSEGDVVPLTTLAKIVDETEPSPVNRLVAEIQERWQKGETPDVAAVLVKHPELKRHRSIVLDLAHQEYRHRVGAGESLEVDEFAGRFPSLQKSLHLLIEVYRLMSQNSAFCDLQESLVWPEPGESFLEFLLIGELGRGTFARVFLASEEALGQRLVALKIAPRGGDEAMIMGRLHHPNIVPVYSVQEDEGSGLTAVCMPYVGTATLGDLLDGASAGNSPPIRARVILDTIRDRHDGSSLPDGLAAPRILRTGSYVNGIVHLIAQLADALAYTHSRGICHRDLKPSNVLLCSDGRPLLLDFNLSTQHQEDTLRIGGTLPYMAPEQLGCILPGRQVDPLRADPRSDLFSLGVIAYELLAGSLPFGPTDWDGSLEETARQMLIRQEKGAPPLQKLNGRVDKRLAILIQKCLAFDPDDRPETADELTASLRRELAPLRRSRRWVRDHPKRVSTFSAILLVAVLLVTAFLATRDAYSVRQFNRGMVHFQQADFEAALPCLTESLRSDPTNREALLARARTYQQLGSFDWALEDFGAAYRLKPEPRIDACKGYCLNRTKHHAEAVDAYQSALDRGFESAAVLNNMGFTYRQLARLDEAEDYLARALAKDEHLSAAHYNLIQLHTRQAYADSSVGPQTLQRAEVAAQNALPAAEFYRDLAVLYALAAGDDPRLGSQAVKYLRAAVEYGFDPKSLVSDPSFESLRQHDEFNTLSRESTSVREPVPTEFLVDPF